MNIYLDINGVLITHNNKPALFVDEFIEHIMWNWPDNTYWLSSYCWRGSNKAVEVLRPFLKPSTSKLTEQIQPSDWGSVKTDAINFKKPFLWFDDSLYMQEKEVLEHYGAIDCLRKIDLYNNPAQLLDEIEYLKSLV